MRVLWCLVVLPRQISNNGMSGSNWESHVTMPVLSLLLSLFSLLLPLMLVFSKTAPTQCSSAHPTAGPVAGANWDNCVVWGWATAVSVQLFLSWSNRVARRFRRELDWHRGRGCNPQRTSKLLDTVCCFVSTATVIVEQCLVWWGGPLRIALWKLRCF